MSPTTSEPESRGPAHGSPDELRAVPSRRSLPCPSGRLEAPWFERPNIVSFLEEEEEALWTFYRPSAKPSFTRETLQDLSLLFAELRARTDRPVRWHVLGSHPGDIYSLGGDLRHFAHCIRARDRDMLRDYALRCIDLVHTTYTGVDGTLLSLAAIQGEALGGGFEAALACDVLIAEEQARAGLPEVLFGLFPGMGAFSFLVRRLGEHRAMDLVRSGRILGAHELRDLGLVDMVVPRGEGLAQARAFIREHRTRVHAMRTMRRSRSRVHPVHREELENIVDIWVDAAFDLGEFNLRKLEKIASAQERMWARLGAPQELPPVMSARTPVAPPASRPRSAPPPAPQRGVARAPSREGLPTGDPGRLADALARRLDHEVDVFLAHPRIHALLAGHERREEAERFALAVAITHLYSPQIFALLFALCPPERSRYALENLREELGTSEREGHPAMLHALLTGLDYAPALQEEILRAAWSELRREFAEPLPYATLRDWGLAALLEVGAFEWMLARCAGPLGDALRRALGLRPDAVEWFEHHAHADKEHARQLLGAVSDYIADYDLEPGELEAIVNTTFVRNVFVRRYLECDTASRLLAEHRSSYQVRPAV